MDNQDAFFRHVQNLKKNIDKYVHYRDEIARNWILSPLVQDVLKTHDIESTYFIDNYASKVLEYFFGVIKGEKKVGQCPVIDSLLEYLKNKDITANELFMICTHAKKSMFDISNEIGTFSHEMVIEISYVFDMNFNGVLNQYANSIYRLEKQVEGEIKKNRERSILLAQQTRMAHLGELISMIAHQWRQPLSNIAANLMDITLKSDLCLYDLSNKNDAKEYEEFVNTKINRISKDIKSLTETIDDFRDFYKVNKNKTPSSIDTLVSKALSILMPTLEENKVHIDFIQFNDDYEKIELYDKEFMQVIINIIKNAYENFQRKGTQEPCIRIIITRKTLNICDNGGGIDENIIDKIFDPYFSTKSEKNETGLGLYMSKIIIEDHHSGKLKVYNKDDGVCFSINI